MNLVSNKIVERLNAIRERTKRPGGLNHLERAERLFLPLFALPFLDSSSWNAYEKRRAVEEKLGTPITSALEYVTPNLAALADAVKSKKYLLMKVL